MAAAPPNPGYCGGSNSRSCSRRLKSPLHHGHQIEIGSTHCCHGNKANEPIKKKLFDSHDDIQEETEFWQLDVRNRLPMESPTSPLVS